MSLIITQTQYFQPSVVDKINAPDQASETETDTEEGKTEASSSPPLTSQPSLISARDIEYLHKFDIRGDELTGYNEILSVFRSNPEHWDNPVAFLRTLSNEGIDLLSRTQRIPEVESMRVSIMSQEEALNFILPQSESVDLNNDGYAGRGNGKFEFIFPPPNAPDNVKEAWYAATDSMSDKDKNLIKVHFLIGQLDANTNWNGDSQPKGPEPGDPDWKNIFDDNDFSYLDMIRTILGKTKDAEDDVDIGSAESVMLARTKALFSHLASVFAAHGIT